MGDRTLRVKGKTNEVAGEAKANVGYDTGSRKTEAKGAGRMLKGKASRRPGRPGAPSEEDALAGVAPCPELTGPQSHC